MVPGRCHVEVMRGEIVESTHRVHVTVVHAEPGLVSPDVPALRLAGEAFEQVFGTPRLLARVGGSIPVVAGLAARGIPAIVTGVATKEANAHSPNECLPAEYLTLGVDAVRETYLRLGELG